MRIGIDAMQLWGEWTGIGRSVWELARRLSADPRGHEYLLYASRGFKRKRELAAPPFQVRRTWFPARSRTLRVAWEQLRLPGRAAREVDLLHAPAYVMPLMSIAPTVVTVHDTIALRYPALVRRASVMHLKRFLPKTLERAELVLVPSGAVARDLADLAGGIESPAHPGSKLDIAEKIRVVPFGVGPEFKPEPDADARARARRELGFEKPYVLFVGRLEPKKNLRRVVEAFFAAVTGRKLPHDLVLAGPGRKTRRLKRIIRELGLTERVRQLGYVPDERLPALYRCADLLLFPSIVEGFGFPVLEAMASGTPCVISKDPALVELAGDAALAVDVHRLDRLREAVECVLADRKTAAKLRAKGLERAGEFTWDRTAELTVAAYEEARARFDGS